MTQLYLYRISQTSQDDYDTYDSAVVCAESVDDARWMDPREKGGARCDFPEWIHHWCKSADLVTVELIGSAAPGVARGVVCASFNAG